MTVTPGTVTPRTVTRKATSATVVTMAAVVLSAACSEGGKHEAAPTPSVSSSSPTASPTPTAAPVVATLDGRPPARGQVVVISVDNSPTARPLQTGFAHAPVVY